jgi:hypothetical protein
MFQNETGSYQMIANRGQRSLQRRRMTSQTMKQKVVERQEKSVIRITIKMASRTSGGRIMSDFSLKFLHQSATVGQGGMQGPRVLSNLVCMTFGLRPFECQ